MSSYHSVAFSVKKDGLHLADFDETFQEGLKIYGEEDVTRLAADSLIYINMHDTEGLYEVTMNFYYDESLSRLSHTSVVNVEQAYVIKVTSAEVVPC